MKTMFFALIRVLRSCLRSRAALQAENIALRHQITVLQRNRKRLRLNSGDRFFWVWLYRLWTGWRSALAIVKPETVIRWHRKGFCLYWAWKRRSAPVGRRVIPPEARDLIRKMSLANSLWGAPRIHGELLKLGINLSQATVAKYMVRQRKPPSQTWQTFLNNHIKDLVAVDFFTVPTVSFRVLYVFVVLAHEMGVLTAPRSPWQNAYAERLIGSISRECLDHVIVLNESSLQRVLNSYFDYYQRPRTHLSLAKDAPEPRQVQPPDLGEVIELPQVGGLHTRYERRVA
jgi:hypothetical protein